MPRHCSVCTHARRNEIDRELLVGQVTLSELGRADHVSRDALRSHRTRHLGELLAACRASPEALTLPQLRAEASRLYEISLDALAHAERGVVVGVDAEGQPLRRVPDMDVARLLREARQNLALVARFNSDSDEPPRDARARRTVRAPSAAARR